MRQTLKETVRIARERHTLKGLLALAFIAAVALLGAGYLLADKTSDNQTTRLALCALRDDVRSRVQSSERYLMDHPYGAPGIPASVIRDGVKNQQRTLKALRILKC